MKRRKEEIGITLIALVVTIIVLLILAGIAISLTVGNNGLFARAKKAANTWKEAEANESEEMSNFEKIYDETLEDLGLDGDKVKINISKTPETEKTAIVSLEVTSVEGLETLAKEKLATMSEEEKKDMLRASYLKVFSLLAGQNFTSWEEIVQFFIDYSGGDIKSEDDLWSMMCGSGSLDDMILNSYSSESGIPLCAIKNPDGEYSEEYIAKENGTYTFIVEDFFMGNQYKSTVEVTNIDKDILFYVDNNKVNIYLIEKEEDKETTFESAFITIDGEKIDISSVIQNINIDDENYSYLYDMDIIRYLSNYEEENYDFWENKIKSIPTKFELVKDGISYSRFLVLRFPIR